jgi:hypothetical protein
MFNIRIDTKFVHAISSLFSIIKTVRFTMYASDPDDAIVPLFAESHRTRELKQVGTGIFIEFLSQPFLFTAAHVTDNLQLSQLWVPAHDSIYPLDGYVGYVDLLPEQSRSDDHIDVAYYRLDSRFARLMLAYFKPWPQSRCELVVNALSLGVCSVCSIPASRSRRHGGLYSSETASYRGVAACMEDYELEALPPEYNIIVRFHKKRAISMETGKRTNPIHPRGMSGGGIFSWPNGNELSDDWSIPKLVGIFHTYKESKGLMIGTPLISVAAAIQVGELKGFGGIH